jgi:hypothetical protein
MPGEIMGLEISSASPELVENPIKRIKELAALRNAKETALLELLSKADTPSQALTDAWFQWRLASGELDGFIQDEIKPRISLII